MSTLSDLEAAGERLRKADEERAAAMAELTSLARKADAEGIPKRQIALLGGVTRATVYKMLETPKEARDVLAESGITASLDHDDASVSRRYGPRAPKAPASQDG